ncbi:hypothetical protein ACROYT_G032100 [Oculina patagonica]
MADEPLLLGLPDGNMGENDDRICGWTTNKIGGTPNWMFGQPSRYPTCPLCSNLLYLVCQIYCPLSDSVFHRVLYVLGCVNKTCWNKNTSWKVLRAQAKDSNFVSKETAARESSSRFEVDDWCDDAEDWGDPDEVSSGLEEFTGKLNLSEDNPDMTEPNKDQQLEISDQDKETSLSCVPHFEPVYISVIEATDVRRITPQMTEHEKTLLLEYQQREGINVTDFKDTDECTNGWTGEKYENTAVKHGDKAFHKFNKQLHACPQQCLRYQWNGIPVSMVTTQPSELCSTVPPCQHCGASRVFEVQFMPALIGQLKVSKQQCSTHDLNPQNTVEDIERCEQFPQKDNKFNLQTLDNSIHRETGASLTEDIDLQEDQKRTFMAAVNQIHDVTIEFGTVMVFSCSKSCWTEMKSVADNGTYLEEFCLVEADPDVTLFQ